MLNDINKVRHKIIPMTKTQISGTLELSLYNLKNKETKVSLFFRLTMEQITLFNVKWVTNGDELSLISRL